MLYPRPEVLIADILFQPRTRPGMWKTGEFGNFPRKTHDGIFGQYFPHCTKTGRISRKSGLHMKKIFSCGWIHREKWKISRNEVSENSALTSSDSENVRADSFSSDQALCSTWKSLRSIISALIFFGTVQIFREFFANFSLFSNCSEVSLPKSRKGIPIFGPRWSKKQTVKFLAVQSSYEPKYEEKSF